MADAVDVCANCGNEFQKYNKTYKRQGLSQKLRGSDTTPVDVLSATFGIQLEVTPKRTAFLCKDCASVTLRLAKSTKVSAEAKKELRGACRDGGYLKRKLDFQTPKKTKARRVVSTPTRKTSIVLETPKVN